MQQSRRNLTKLLSLGLVFPTQVMSALSAPTENMLATASNTSSTHSIDLQKLYNNAIVIDGMIISRGWDKDSFDALQKTGYTGFHNSLNSSSLSVAKASLNEWRKRIDENPSTLLLATSANDFLTAKKEGKTAVFCGFQNTKMIGDSIDNIDTLYDLGTRWMQLTYNERNLLGDGSTERTNAGLSDFGIEAVERMNELGIAIDLSHCGRQTTMDGITYSKKGATINHSMCEALYRNHPRAKTDEQLRAMADKGGVIGIIGLGYMVGPDPGGKTTLENYVDHIEHAINIAGIDHVAMASDFPIQGMMANGATKENWYTPRLTRFKPSYQVRWPAHIPELDSTDRFRNVIHVLEKRKFTASNIEKLLGQNWIRYYQDTL
ncbi:membrane dipeptidase [Alteromonas sp. 1_MG-2023]|uniref:dipeptidase n=1 Tax=Alteromonas sp. 1_MG-2023 TaxID=3062669 RepID=UPI0026E2C8E2|nr:membrane dipeptidase [Alteromonas sp. 1_MG-2023]MDO6565914.1 membrane dipeptidase [Alteromonas sp. 1_MG-2023]